MSRRRTGRDIPGRSSGSSEKRNPQMRKAARSKRLPHRFSGVNIRPASATNITDTGSQTYTFQKGVDEALIEMIGGGGGGEGEHRAAEERA